MAVRFPALVSPCLSNAQQRTMSAARVAVVGHVEWVDFAVVDHFPVPGGIVHASHFWQDAAAGGAVAAVQLVKLAGTASFFTALSSDPLGSEAAARLAGLGVDLHVGERSEPQRRPSCTSMPTRRGRSACSVPGWSRADPMRCRGAT